MKRLWRSYSYGWVIGALFLGSLAIFMITGWYAYVQEQLQQGHPVDVGQWANLMLRDGFENLQSEFLQLLCQVGLLTWLLFKGSPQSKDEHDRMERKLDDVRRAISRIEEKQDHGRF